MTFNLGGPPPLPPPPLPPGLLPGGNPFSRQDDNHNDIYAPEADCSSRCQMGKRSPSLRNADDATSLNINQLDDDINTKKSDCKGKIVTQSLDRADTAVNLESESDLGQKQMVLSASHA